MVPDHASIIETIRRKFPPLEPVLQNGVISVPAADSRGFTVCLYQCNGEWIVGYDGWHEHFKSLDEAMRCFAYAFSGASRLKVSLRGDRPHAWTLEILSDGEWRAVSTTGRLFFALWRPRRVEYLQNTPIPRPIEQASERTA